MNLLVNMGSKIMKYENVTEVIIKDGLMKIEQQNRYSSSVDIKDIMDIEVW